jgi:hypothetical protein
MKCQNAGGKLKGRMFFDKRHEFQKKIKILMKIIVFNKNNK